MERHLTTILAADVVGYSRLMGEDEAGTLAALKAHRAELSCWNGGTAFSDARSCRKLVTSVGDYRDAVFIPNLVSAIVCRRHCIIGTAGAPP